MHTNRTRFSILPSFAYTKCSVDSGVKAILFRYISYYNLCRISLTNSDWHRYFRRPSPSRSKLFAQPLLQPFDPHSEGRLLDAELTGDLFIGIAFQIEAFEQQVLLFRE